MQTDPNLGETSACRPTAPTGCNNYKSIVNSTLTLWGNAAPARFDGGGLSTAAVSTVAALLALALPSLLQLQLPFATPWRGRA